MKRQVKSVFSNNVETTVTALNYCCVMVVLDYAFVQYLKITLRKHAYSNILKILHHTPPPPKKKGKFSVKKFWYFS